MGNFVYIAASIDGFIARTDGSIDWLTNLDNPEETDYGYGEFIDNIDAIVMGRKTFEFAIKMDPWPYNKPVFVLSSTLSQGTDDARRISIVNLRPGELTSALNSRGQKNLYVDGGRTIQGFLAEDLIDEMVITRIPVLLGSGIPLFGNINREIRFHHVDSVAYRNGLVKSVYRRG